MEIVQTNFDNVNYLVDKYLERDNLQNSISQHINKRNAAERIHADNRNCEQQQDEEVKEEFLNQMGDNNENEVRFY